MNQNSVTMETRREAKDLTVQTVRNFAWTLTNYKNQNVTGSGFFEINEQPKAYIRLFMSKLVNNVMNDNIVTFKVRHFLLENMRSPVKIKLSFGKIDEGTVFFEVTNNSAFGYSIREAVLLPLLSPDGSLEVYFEITSLTPLAENESLDKEKNFKSFLKNRSPCDMVFKIDEEEIPAHKIVLASVSSIFDKMFFPQTELNSSGVVKIKAVESNVFKEFLGYIYTDRVRNLENMAFGLYELSDKFDIAALREICENYLCESLLVDNVINVLHLADQNESVNLKKKCFEYMDRHFEQVRETESFKNLQLKGELLMEFLCAMRMKKPRYEKSTV